MKFKIIFIDEMAPYKGVSLDVNIQQLNPSDSTKKEVDLTAGGTLGIVGGPVFEIKEVTYLPEVDMMIIKALYDTPNIVRS